MSKLDHPKKEEPELVPDRKQDVPEPSSQETLTDIHDRLETLIQNPVHVVPELESIAQKIIENKSMPDIASLREPFNNALNEFQWDERLRNNASIRAVLALLNGETED